MGEPAGEENSISHDMDTKRIWHLFSFMKFARNDYDKYGATNHRRKNKVCSLFT